VVFSLFLTDLKVLNLLGCSTTLTAAKDSKGALATVIKSFEAGIK